MTFQIMMNDLLRNIIEVGNIAMLINSVIVEMEIEKEYNNIVLRRITKNNLFVKPEKCMWKIRKIEFLGVVIVIGPDEIKMEKEKVREVVDWLVPKNIKNM